MFRPSFTRFRALLEFADDVLGDPYDEVEPPLAQLHHHGHPHRRPLRWERSRRPGSVPARPAHCLSPVRPGRSRDARERIG